MHSQTAQGKFDEDFHKRWNDVLRNVSLELTALLHAEYRKQLAETKEKLDFNLQFLTTISSDTNQDGMFAKEIEGNIVKMQSLTDELTWRRQQKLEANTKNLAPTAPPKPCQKPQKERCQPQVHFSE